ncbi:MAG: hypothetical protein WC972_05195 [Trueperaceae bacterium]|nr:hypothetical protein [Trueperaceae bacterium]
MFDLSHTKLRAGLERVHDLRARAAHHSVLKAVRAHHRERAREAALEAVRAELAEMEARAATAWKAALGRPRVHRGGLGRAH